MDTSKIEQKSTNPDLRTIESRVAPRTELEREIASIWEEVLEVSQVGVRDNFFKLGGDSLTALDLFSNIEKTFGKRLPLATLFQAPTIEQLANLLTQKGWSPSWSSLVTMRRGGSKLPLFFVHPGGGEIVCYQGLAEHLDPEQPFYGLRPQGLDGQKAPLTQVDEMAAAYIKEMLTVQPKGPYFLGGYSFGGLVSLEMAQQLHAQGQKVELLILLDTYGPDWRKPLPSRTGISDYLHNIKGHLVNILRLEPREKILYLLRRQKIKRWLQKILPNLYPAVEPSSAPEVSTKLAIHDAVHKAHTQATANYVPQVYSGRVILFRAREQPQDCWVDPQLGWEKLVARGLEIHDVPGDHYNMLDDVSVLPGKLQACLDEAQSNALGIKPMADLKQ